MQLRESNKRGEVEQKRVKDWKRGRGGVGREEEGMGQG